MNSRRNAASLTEGGAKSDRLNMSRKERQSTRREREVGAASGGGADTRREHECRCTTSGLRNCKRLARTPRLQHGASVRRT